MLTVCVWSVRERVLCRWAWVYVWDACFVLTWKQVAAPIHQALLQYIWGCSSMSSIIFDMFSAILHYKELEILNIQVLLKFSVLALLKSPAPVHKLSTWHIPSTPCCLFISSVVVKVLWVIPVMPLMNRKESCYGKCQTWSGVVLEYSHSLSWLNFVLTSV